MDDILTVGAETPLHPLAGLFPGLDHAGAIALADSIRAMGTLNPVTLYEGKLLDGKLRRDAAVHTGRRAPARTLPRWVEPIDFIIAQNLTRRHYTTGQRAMLSAGIRRSLRSPSERARYTLTALAQAAGIPERTAKRRARVLRECTPEISTAAMHGEVRLADAQAMGRHPPETQASALKRVRNGEAKTLRGAIASKRAAAKPAVAQPNRLRKWLEAMAATLTDDAALGACGYVELRGYINVEDARSGAQPKVRRAITLSAANAAPGSAT